MPLHECNLSQGLITVAFDLAALKGCLCDKSDGKLKRQKL